MDWGQSWREVEDPVEVILHVKTSGGLEAQPVGVGFRRDVSEEDVSDEPALLEGASTVFHLWAEQLPDGVEPKKGDKVESAGVTWSVTSLKRQSRGTRFRCVCVMDR